MACPLVPNLISVQANLDSHKGSKKSIRSLAPSPSPLPEHHQIRLPTPPPESDGSIPALPSGSSPTQAITNALLADLHQRLRAGDLSTFLRCYVRGKGKRKIDLGELHAALEEARISQFPPDVLAESSLYALVCTLAEMHHGDHLGEAAKALAREWEAQHGLAALIAPLETDEA